MASSAKLIASLFLLTLLFIQIHARESHFFSKVPNNGETQTQIPNKVLDPLTNSEKTTTNPQDQEPNFIPQTQDNGYGLYGHESGQLPPNFDAKFSDPSAGRPFTTTYDNDNNYRTSNDALPAYNSESENQYYNDNFQNSNSKKPYENSFYYNKDLYDNGRQSFQNTRLSRDDFTTTTPSYDDNNNYNFYFNNNNNGGGDNANNVARQGMSDTRFMENGKYFYDLNREPHHYSMSRGSFGNNHYNYNNNGNTYEYGNSMGRYQNDEAEFQEESDDFVP